MRDDGFNFWFQRTPLLIDGDRVIKNGATINAFPRVEHQKEVRKTFQCHQPFAS